jgi:hypothetical protein
MVPNQSFERDGNLSSNTLGVIYEICCCTRGPELWPSRLALLRTDTSPRPTSESRLKFNSVNHNICETWT